MLRLKLLGRSLSWIQAYGPNSRDLSKRCPAKVKANSCIVLVPRTPIMHKGAGGGVAAVQSSCNFICCSGMRTATTR